MMRELSVCIEAEPVVPTPTPNGFATIKSQPVANELAWPSFELRLSTIAVLSCKNTCETKLVPRIAKIIPPRATAMTANIERFFLDTLNLLNARNTIATTAASNALRE